MLAFSNDYYGFIFRATQSVELFCAYVIFMSLVLLVSLIISSFNILRKNPKELLIDNN